MVKISFRDVQGSIRRIDAGEGMTVKDVALESSVSGIVGTCGGYANCATCHVYVDEEWLDKLPEMDEAEDIILDGTVCERTASSRLACQLFLTADLDGLTVTLPQRQM